MGSFPLQIESLKSYNSEGFFIKKKAETVHTEPIAFLCIYLNQVNHFKVLRGGIKKNWVFHLPYRLGYGSCLVNRECECLAP